MKPITTRLTSSRSIGVLPTRSPMPSAAACTRVAPASSAAMLLMIARSRSRWPCQSMPTSAPLSLITCIANRTTADAPHGVAWPTVSARQMRCAPARIAHS